MLIHREVFFSSVFEHGCRAAAAVEDKAFFRGTVGQEEEEEKVCGGTSGEEKDSLKIRRIRLYEFKRGIYTVSLNESGILLIMHARVEEHLFSRMTDS